MKQTISTIAAIAALLVSMQTDAKGPPGRAVMLTDANGVEIGRVIGMERLSLPYVLTDEGYRTMLNLGISENPALVGTVREVIYYQNANCVKDDPKYVDSPGNAGTVFSPMYDLEEAYDQGLLMYAPITPESETVTVTSVSRDGECENFGDAETIEIEGYRVYLNDPSITGIENTRYPSRLILR